MTSDDQYQLAFSFVSEVQGQLDRNYFSPAMQAYAEKAKPSHLCTYFSPKSKRFYLYVGVG
mgnify:CR=1 FL=1